MSDGNRSRTPHHLTLETWDGVVVVYPLAGGLHHVVVRHCTAVRPSPIRDIVTPSPLSLLCELARVKGAGYICDEIARAESPGYVEADLRRDLLGFVAPSRLRGGRILDFGCGSGASTVVLARLFPEAAAIDGVEVNPEFAHLAELRMETMPDGPRLAVYRQTSTMDLRPLDTYDLIVLSAVIEHMLPNERCAVLPQLWALLRAGGYSSATPRRTAPLVPY